MSAWWFSSLLFAFMAGVAFTGLCTSVSPVFGPHARPDMRWDFSVSLFVFCVMLVVSVLMDLFGVPV